MFLQNSKVYPIILYFSSCLQGFCWEIIPNPRSASAVCWRSNSSGVRQGGKCEDPWDLREPKRHATNSQVRFREKVPSLKLPAIFAPEKLPKTQKERDRIPSIQDFRWEHVSFREGKGAKGAMIDPLSRWFSININRIQIHVFLLKKYTSLMSEHLWIWSFFF